jgi:anaerobic ribonucleoside-triphosphate reductase
MSEDTPSVNPPEGERQRCEVWTRVMGYHRPVSEFNPGKQSEHRERRHFDEPAGERLEHA